MSLTKTAAGLFGAPPKPGGKPPTEQQKQKRREYYLRNREERKREGKKWRMEHSALLKKYKKRYNRQVKAGARVPQMRARAGMGYQFLGQRPQKTQESTSSNTFAVRTTRL
jgi:hypothetical protein